MTIATMGRLMKKLAMAVTCFRLISGCFVSAAARTSLRRRRPWFRYHLRAGFDFLHTFDDHFFARLQPRGDHPVSAQARARL